MTKGRRLTRWAEKLQQDLNAAKSLEDLDKVEAEMKEFERQICAHEAALQAAKN